MSEEIERWTKKRKVRKATISSEDEEMFRRAREAEPSKIITRPEDTLYGPIYSGRHLVEDPSSEGKLTREDKASIRAHIPLPYGIFSVPSLGEEGPGDYQDTHAYKFDSPAYRKWLKTVGRGREASKVFYHVTPLTRVKNILRKGLVPGSANVAGMGLRLPGIYVTDDIQVAITMFAVGYEARTTREKKFALLEVRPTKDCYISEDPELSDIMDYDEIGRGYILYCTIPPSNIKVLRTFTPPKNVEDPVELVSEIVKGKKGPTSDEDRFEAFLKWEDTYGKGKKK